ncbi:GntR family transcriptional regulator [Vagococcus elongatus]|uniref:HTH gntR-type domain-containing protein n=1 Tax=Vagococcus elongatus TaxID=180344 RepID=A0A430AP51_9ENTE|nr:GntR family transcriptional regulator [Vagococcus elongatus]RSU09684.1 hypothetical protein CBF29_10930 [Vagococcus elongatus]
MGKKKAETRVLDYLMTQITNGKLTPKMKLNEVDVALELNVSRSPVRAAFKKLESLGYLEIRPNKGAFVREKNLTQQEFIDRMQVFELLFSQYMFDVERWEQIFSEEKILPLTEKLTEVQKTEEQEYLIKDLLTEILIFQKNHYYRELMMTIVDEFLAADFSRYSIRQADLMSLFIKFLSSIVSNLLLRKYAYARKEIRLFVNRVSLQLLDKQEIIQNKYQS